MKKGKVPFTCIPDFPSLRKDNNRREALTLQQLNTITTHMRTKEFLEFDKENLHRYFVRDFVGLLSNTGIRFGEARRLKWKHIKVVKGKKETNKRDWIVEIKLSENMTKNKKARTVQGRPQTPTSPTEPADSEPEKRTGRAAKPKDGSDCEAAVPGDPFTRRWCGVRTEACCQRVCRSRK